MATIADLYLARAQQAGEARRRQGDITAQLFGNLASIVGDTTQRLAQERQEAPRREMANEAARIDLENARAGQATARQAMEDKAILQSALSMDLDPDAIEGQLKQLGRGDLAQSFRKSWMDSETAAGNLRKLRADLQSAEAEYWGALAAGVKPYLGEQDGGVSAVRMALAKAKRDGYEEADQWLQQVEADPSQLSTMVDGLIQASPTQRKLLGEEADRSLRRDQEARALETAKQATADRAADNARLNAQAAETARHNRAMEARPVSGGNRTEGGLTPTMESNVINRLTNQWGAAVKPVAELDRQVKLMETGLEAARRGDMAQGSQAVLVTFQKILDPTSVVRESEYARSAAGLALDERIKGALTRLQSGGAGVTLSELEKFARLAREAAEKQSTGRIDAMKERIGRNADRFKIPRDLIFEDFSFAPQAEPVAPPDKPVGPSAADPLGLGF